MKNTGLVFTFLFLSIFVCISNPIFANRDKMPSSMQPNDSPSLNEATAYRMLYDNQVKANDAILKTIFYALGGLATAVVLVFASNWWFNEKRVADIRNGINVQINEAKNTALNEVETRISSLAAEKTTQINELQNKLQEHISTSIADITLRANEFHEIIRAEIKEDNKTLLGNYQTQLESFNINYRQQISTLSENIKNQTDTIKDKINIIENNLKKEMSSATNSLKQQIARNEYYMWKYRGVWANALSAQIRELELILEESSDFPIYDRSYDFYLTGITETLKNISDMFSSDKENIINTINKVPNEYNRFKLDLLKALETIEIKEL